MRTKYEQLSIECILEMFRRVGLEFSKLEEVEKWISECGNPEAWYTVKTWTEKEQDSFRDWMDDLLKAKTRDNKKKRDWEIGCFILNYGWKVN